MRPYADYVWKDMAGPGPYQRLDQHCASRPFDRQRDGFVLSEGACALVLENLETALKREAKMYGEVIGYGNTVDAFHQTKPDIRGEIHALRSALDEAGVGPDEIDYISAHGTSTQIGDYVESEAILAAFGEKAPHIPVSAIKSMTGHMLAASGAFEAACTAMSLLEGIVPPTINIREKDSRCGINLITERSHLPIRTALSSSFGFGGVNAVLVLRKLELRIERYFDHREHRGQRNISDYQGFKSLASAYLYFLSQVVHFLLCELCGEIAFRN